MKFKEVSKREKSEVTMGFERGKGKQKRVQREEKERGSRAYEGRR